MSRFSTRPAASTSIRSSTQEPQRKGKELFDSRAGHDAWKAGRPGNNQGAAHKNRSSDGARPKVGVAKGTSDVQTKRSSGRRRRRKRSASASTPKAEEEDAARITACGIPIEGSSRSGTCCQRNSDGAAQRLFERVAAIHWVDGGNGGVAGGSFPINLCSLARLAAIPNLAIRVHGTPYQWGNLSRPWLVYEAADFVSSVEGFRQTLNPFAATSSTYGSTPPEAQASSLSQRAGTGVSCDVGGNSGLAGGIETASGDAGDERSEEDGHGPAASTACDVKRLLYFESEQPSLENHFRVLAELNTD